MFAVGRGCVKTIFVSRTSQKTRTTVTLLGTSPPANCKREHSHARFVFERGVFTQPLPKADIDLPL